MKLRDEMVLQRIVSESDLVEKMLADVGPDAFMGDEVLKRAVGMATINIGELANHLTDEFVEQHPNIDLVMAIRARNVYAHGYFTLDFNDVYDTARHDFPRLREWAASVLANEAVDD